MAIRLLSNETIDGNVGIGTTSPAQPLSVHGNFLVRTTNTDGNKNRMQCLVGGSADAANLYLYYGNSGDGTVSVRINAQGDSYFNGGNVGIGTNNPQTALTLPQGTGAANKISWYDGTPTFAASIYANSSNDTLTFATKNASNVETTAMVIDIDQYVGIGITSPDAKLHIQGSSTEQKVLEISTAQSDGPYTAYKNTGSGTTTLGFIGNSQGIMNAGTSNFGIRANNDLTFSSGGSTERMRITSAGNVGIGTNSPGNILHVSSAGSDTYVRIGNNAGYDAGIYFNTSADWTIGTDTSNSNAFTIGNGSSVGASPKLTIETGGNIGIGTASPTSPTSVARFLEIEGATAGIVLHDSDVEAWDLYASGGKLGTRYNNGANGWWLDSSGNMGIGTTSPSEELDVRNDGANGIATIGVRGGTNGAGVVAISGHGTTYGSTSFDLIQNSSGAYVYNRSNTLMIFGTNNTERMRINNDGTVGIGGTSNGSQLEIIGGGYNSIRIGSTQAANTNKLSGISMNNYQGNGTSIFQTFCQSGSNTIYYGSADGGFRGVQAHYFMVNSNSDSTSGHTTAMLINSSGNVGIGTTSPQTQLQITSNTTTKLRVNTTGVADSMVEILGYDAGVHIGDNSNGNRWAIWNDGPGTSTSLNFGSYALGTWYVPGSQVMTMTSAGNVGVGDTSAPNKLSVKDTANLTCRFTGGTTFSLYQNNTDSTVIFSANHGNASPAGVEKRFIWQMAGGTAKMKLDDGTLTVSADLIAYGSPSDKRLKENIKPINSALEKVSKLQGVTFDWKDKKRDKAYDPDQGWKHDIGFIAQDVQKVIPELVRENKDGMLSMRHQGMAPILLEAIKELKAEIEELKKSK